MYNRLTTRVEYITIGAYYPTKAIANMFIQKSMKYQKRMNKYALNELIFRANEIYKSITGRYLISEQPKITASGVKIPSISQFYAGFSAEDFIDDYMYAAKLGTFRKKVLMFPTPDAAIQLSVDEAWNQLMRTYDTKQ